jgi:hypothetical protein
MVEALLGLNISEKIAIDAIRTKSNQKAAF